MVRISKRKLDDVILDKIYRLFFEVISRSNNKNMFLEIIEDIFSPTEKVMLAKRIMIIYLLVKGIDQRNIAQALKVSTATVSGYALQIHNKNTSLLKVMKKILIKEKTYDFLERLLLEIFLQPGIKKGHVRLYWSHKIEKDRKKIRGL